MISINWVLGLILLKKRLLSLSKGNARCVMLMLISREQEGKS